MQRGSSPATGVVATRWPGRGPARCWGSLRAIDGPPPAGRINDVWDRDVDREQCRTYPRTLHSRLKAYQRRCPTTHDIMACVLHRGGLEVVSHPAPNALEVVLPIEHGSKMAIATDAR